MVPNIVGGFTGMPGWLRTRHGMPPLSKKLHGATTGDRAMLLIFISSSRHQTDAIASDMRDVYVTFGGKLFTLIFINTGVIDA